MHVRLQLWRNVGEWKYLRNERLGFSYSFEGDERAETRDEAARTVQTMVLMFQIECDQVGGGRRLGGEVETRCGGTGDFGLGTVRSKFKASG